MKDCKSVCLFRWSGYPFTAYGKRGRAWTLIEWEWGDALVRIPLDRVAKNPDVAMSVAVSKVLRLRPRRILRGKIMCIGGDVLLREEL